MAFCRATSRCILPVPQTTTLLRGFVSATIPSQKAKVDKEASEKIIQAADTVIDGTKEVVKDVKSARKAVTDKLVNATGNVVADVAKNRFEKAAETAQTEKGRDFLDTGKAAAEALKKKVDK